MNLDDLTKRINELARKAKTPEGLTEEELKEREVLRNEYRARFRASLTSQLEHTSIKELDGSIRKLTKKDDK